MNRQIFAGQQTVEIALQRKSTLHVARSERPQGGMLRVTVQDDAPERVTLHAASSDSYASGRAYISMDREVAQELVRTLQEWLGETV